MLDLSPQITVGRGIQKVLKISLGPVVCPPLPLEVTCPGPQRSPRVATNIPNSKELLLDPTLGRSPIWTGFVASVLVPGLGRGRFCLGPSPWHCFSA